MFSFLMALMLAGGPAGKLAPDLAAEMEGSVLAVTKVLGLESWPTHGVKPCVDHGSPARPTKVVTADEARKCASTAVEKGVPRLGKSYVIAILMAATGPVTVIAVGTGDASGWAAYSCDPGRKCRPQRMDPGTKWGKRLVDRHAKACAQPDTMWLPAGSRACPGAGDKPIETPSADAKPGAPPPAP